MMFLQACYVLHVHMQSHEPGLVRTQHNVLYSLYQPHGPYWLCILHWLLQNVQNHKTSNTTSTPLNASPCLLLISCLFRLEFYFILPLPKHVWILDRGYSAGACQIVPFFPKRCERSLSRSRHCFCTWYDMASYQLYMGVMCHIWCLDYSMHGCVSSSVICIISPWMTIVRDGQHHRASKTFSGDVHPFL